MSNFGDNLRILREEANYSITYLSELSGFSRRTIYRWENGCSVPRSYGIREILAKIFHVSPYYFDDKDILKNDPIIKRVLARLEQLENRLEQLENQKMSKG